MLLTIFKEENEKRYQALHVVVAITSGVTQTCSLG